MEAWTRHAPSTTAHHPGGRLRHLPAARGGGVDAVVSAIEVGYRLLDTAVNYENEREVGEAIRRSGVPREEIFVTSKIPGRHHGYDDAIRSTHGSLERLGLDYLDLHLIHWPNPSVGKYAEAWRALVDLREQGLVRSIGVSNFTEEHLERIIAETGVTPAVNQVELHPCFPQEEMRAVDEGRASDRVVEPAGQAPGDVPDAAVARPPSGSASPRARSSCAGRSSSAPSRSQVRLDPSGSARTSTCSASS